MATSGGVKLATLKGVAPGAMASGKWNNANAEIYSLNAWPVVVPGKKGSAKVTDVTFLQHGNPQERELHFAVKNTGASTIDIEVWATWWNA